jgi:hypothetical protein
MSTYTTAKDVKEHITKGKENVKGATTCKFDKKEAKVGCEAI